MSLFDQQPTDPRYTISPDGKAITCRFCGLTSHHPTDVANRYCGHCNKFHEAVVYAGPSAGVIAAIADLAAIWLAGHLVSGDPAATATLRRELWEAHCRAVWELVNHYDSRR